MNIIGRIHSIESMGLVDGPGIRTVFFLQGCPLRCAFCHNPDTQAVCGGKAMSPTDVLKVALRYRNFHGIEGGITFSGGEPLLQGEFVYECVKLLKKHDFHIALDTSGFGDTRFFSAILPYIDVLLLDVKAFEKDNFFDLVVASMDSLLTFMQNLRNNGFEKVIWIRHVMIPGYTDNEAAMRQFIDLIIPIAPMIERIEILPYHTMGVHKYQALNMPYRLAGVAPMDHDKAKALERYANRYYLNVLSQQRKERQTIVPVNRNTNKQKLSAADIAAVKEKLAHISLLRDIQDEGLQEVLNAVELYWINKDELLFQSGDSYNYMYIICKGHLKIFDNTSDGKEQIFYIYNENDFVGGHNLLSKTPYLYSCQALEDSLIAAIPFKEFECYLANNVTVLQRILDKSFDRIRWAENLIARLATSNASMKVAGLLLRLVDTFGISHAQGIHVNLTLNREELGSYSGLTRETITRKLGEFKDLGYIEIINNREIIIKDLEAIKQFVY